jgi:predicted nucleotidyltransferase
MSQLLAELADHVGVNERTLRRAVAEGTIHAERESAYKLRCSIDERRYVRKYWPVIGALRNALRTEPSVEAAVLFGSLARGDDDARSDIDLLVWRTGRSEMDRAALARRLDTCLGRPVHVVDATAAERQPGFLLSIVRDGRVLVDRGGRWSELRSNAPSLRRRAARERRKTAEQAETARRSFAQTRV